MAGRKMGAKDTKQGCAPRINIELTKSRAEPKNAGWRLKSATENSDVKKCMTVTDPGAD
jgi:hypothetical protein